MELRYRREAAVGFMLVFSTALFVVLMMWLRGRSFRAAEVVDVAFQDVAGLKEGDPVRTSGVGVGTVRRITLESLGVVHVLLEVRQGAPREDASAKILSADLFGARYIEYSPGRSARALPRDSALRGTRMQDLGEMADVLGAKGRNLLDSAGAAVFLVSRELRAALRNTQTLMATLNTGAAGSSERLQGALEELRRSLQRVDLILAQNGPVATQALSSMRDVSLHADSLTRTLAHASVQFDSILAKVNGGRGPAAALLNDSTVVRDLMSTNTALRALLVDFQANPGRYIRVRMF